jgi:hypothetical protein
VRTLGIAFGSALAGVIATLAGLSAQVDAALVLRAVRAVYALIAVVAALQLVMAWRLLRLVPARRPSPPPAG